MRREELGGLAVSFNHGLGRFPMPPALGKVPDELLDPPGLEAAIPPGGRVQRTWPITGTAPGIPDSTSQVQRDYSVWGYSPEPDESIGMVIIIATAAPGAYPFTIAGIAAGATQELMDPMTALNGIRPLANEDYIIKEAWVAFDQPMRYLMYQDGPADYSCDVPVPAFTTTPVYAFPVGWTRSQVEPWNVATITYVRVTNLSARTAYGKAWVVYFKKPSQYLWY